MKLTAETIIKLSQVKGIGRVKILRLSEMVEFTPSSDQELSEVLAENLELLKAPYISSGEILKFFQSGESLLEKSIKLGIKTISLFDSNYPALLKNTINPPLILNIMGDYQSLIDFPTVAVIGTRDPSNYGKVIGERIGYLLAQNSISVVSGLAKGCDTAAHVGCLKGRGKTIAVLAHGLDSIYPRENKQLAEKIIDTGGCLVSEYMINTRALSNFFIDRDRIQAGLSKATIVVETDIKGGTMHTVNYTLEYNRILTAFHHPPEKQNEKSRGNEMLINDQKATGLQTKEDIEALIHLINPVGRKQFTLSSIPIAEVQLPLFNEAEFDMLLSPPKEKIKKTRKKRTKPDLIQSKIFKDESDIRPGPDTDQ
jgi:DNA processing protein